MAASTATPAAPTATTASAVVGSEPVTCPNCSFPNLPDALFCENCGYDFTTGSLPEPEPQGYGAPSVLASPAAVPDAPAVVPLVAPVSALDIDAKDVGEHAAESDPGYAEAPAIEGQPVVEPAGAASPEARAESGPPAEVSASGALAPDLEGDDAWVAEVWIDPEWYAAQKSDEPLPSGGLPDIVVLKQSSVLVGRTSVSRDIHPQIDCGIDSGVSRRQCQLNTDGQRWWVEDLQSSNGTYVGAAGDELPSVPIQPGQRREVHDGDRIFVGAWTRLVIRKALPGEV
ncbi:FHA domain-containing protein [Agreia sp. COWG]|uniref:FHA domain-containing protein n=1 Tax=Agreia sp. COWG TaxID=2773266 RepID=UPI001928305B|nr:FHA domain-containing protein [Agreia sp. COWG]